MGSYMYYKDYVSEIQISEEDKVLYGKLIGIKDLVTFEGKSADELIKDFHNAVDEYLKLCIENGKKPDKPYKGSFNVRVGPELHRKAALYATEHNQSLNSFIVNAIEDKLNKNKWEMT